MENKKLSILHRWLSTFEFKLFISLPSSGETEFGAFLKWLQTKGSYFYVCEPSKLGVHYHILINEMIPFDWISQNWPTPTTTKAITDLPGVLDYILKGLSSLKEERDSTWYGTNLFDIAAVNKEVECQLENDTISRSADMIEESIYADRESAAYQLFKFFGKFYSEFSDHWFDELRSASRSEDNLTRLLVERLKLNSSLYNTVVVYVIKYLHIEFNQVSFLENLMCEALCIGSNPLQHERRVIKTKRELHEFAPIQTVKIGKKLLEFFLESCSRDNLRLNYEELPTPSGRGRTVARFEVHNFLKDLVERLALEGFLYGKLPMTFPPVDWEVKPRDLRKNYTGGYLLNQEHHLFPLTEAFGSNAAVLSSANSKLIRAVNRMQSNAFKFDFDLYDLLVGDFYRGRLVQVIEYYARQFSRQFGVALESVRFKKRSTILKHYGQMALHAISSYSASKARLNQLDHLIKYIEVFKSYLLKGDSFYFPYKVDFRTRFYANSDLSPVEHKFIRVLLRSAEPVPFDLEWFKFYATKCYSSKKMSFDERMNYFDKDVHDRLSSYKNSVFDDERYGVDDPLAFAACCVEYDRYLKFKETYPDKDYYSGFMVSVDATASGNQVIALLLNDSFYTEFLNLKVASTSGTPKSIYNEIGNQYIDYIHLNDTCLASLFTRVPKEQNESFMKSLFKELLMKRAYGLTLHTYINNCTQLMSNKYRHLNFDDKECVRICMSTWKYVNEQTNLFRILEIFSLYAKLFTDNGLRIIWTTPLGVKIRMFYNEIKTQRIKVNIKTPIQTPARGRRCRYMQKTFTYNEVLDTIDKRRTIFSLTPNFIHSFDASVIGLFSCAVDKNLCYFTVHDQVVCPTGSMTGAHVLIRKVNYQLFKQKDVFRKVLDTLDKQLLGVSVLRDNDIKQVRAQADAILEGIKDRGGSVYDITELLDAFNMYS